MPPQVIDEAIAEYREAVRINKAAYAPHINLGNALKAKGKVDDAIAAFREAIRLSPNFPLAHINLGLALLDKGEFGAAVESLRRGHELGSRTPRWAYSEQFLRRAETLAGLDDRLPAVLLGKDRPKD